MTHGFDWLTLYLTCFVLGLVLAVLSVLTGAFHLHLGRIHLHGTKHQHHMSPLNAFTITGFLCWFGAAGYLMQRAHTLAALAVLAIALVCGGAGAGLLMWFMVGVLMKHEKTLEPADTEIVGVLGRVSQPARGHGVGEMLYTQNGSRRSVAIRSDDGQPLPKGTDVIVMSFAKGVATVKPWVDFEQSLMSGPEEPAVRE